MVITRGDTLKLKIKYLNSSKEPIILSEESFIRFTVKDKIDGEKIFQITLTSENYDEIQQCYYMTIQPEYTQNVDMQGLEKIDCLYDFELTDKSNINEIVVRTINKGKFTIKYDITTN